MSFEGGTPLVGFERPPKAVHHDHVGHMIFAGETCCCTVCGQEWEMTYKAGLDHLGDRVRDGWRPISRDSS